MKTLLFTLFTLLSLVLNSFAQDFQGMAVYESKTSTADFQSNFAGNREITPEMQKMFEERMKRMFEKKFILTFDRNSSIYKEEEKLETPGQGGGGMRMMGSMMGGGGTHYKNVKEKYYAVDKEFFGKEFLVKDSLPVLDWKLGTETKQIGNYLCFKATAVRPVSQSDFRNFRRRAEGDKKDTKETEQAEAPKTESKTTNFMDGWEMPKEIEITAWYAPDIPINQGPENYWGLPGLILEVSDGKTVILCSKLVLNTKEKKEIKAPKNGKVVTQQEYDKIVMEKTKEMREMNQGQGGRSFRFGG
ncbi:GLPGLI family protein [Flavobacterium sp.]|uniref:GLPGLI family protein n=1 Tax=Flavobacterium sp. TaxID=239 RepID=UPI002FD8D7FC